MTLFKILFKILKTLDIMGLIDTATTTGTLSIYIPFILIILLYYLSWIGSYDFNDEFCLGFLLVILGLMYASAIYLIATHESTYGSSLAFLTIIIIICVAGVSGFKQQDGSQGSTFICQGVTPMLSGICFSFVALCIGYYMRSISQVSAII
jgi:hypothetical protein